ncbi:MAG: AmpG family muropeptide MFS transporter [Nitrospirota bacterium]
MSRAPSGWRAVWPALRAPRTAAVTLLSFSSGLPLGLVWIAIPTWLAQAGVDIKVIGLFTLAQAPWTFKFAWSPLMDRYALPLPRLGRKLGWALATQVALLALTLWLARLASHPDALWLIGSVALAIAFASASQDIALDAYAVEVLRPEEQGVAVGARTALYRAAMFTAGGLAITLAGSWSWSTVFAALAIAYVPLALVTLVAPRSDQSDAAAPRSLREAVWDPFVGFLATQRAWEILAFVVFYKLADNLAGALVRPFLVQTGFDNVDVGVATATIGLFATLAGTFVGGAVTTGLGLGHALWLFGGLQIISNLGYVAVAVVGLNRAVMYAAMGFESLTTGMGTGAFGVLLLRMTQKRFSATQYALFSSLFALPRLFSGPVTGVLVDAIGWRDFFLFTMAVGIPGLVMLQRFCPLGAREPRLQAHAAASGPAVSVNSLFVRGCLGAAGAIAAAALTVAALAGMKAVHKDPGAPFALLSRLADLTTPQTLGGWAQLAGITLFGLAVGLAIAATAAARAGAKPPGDPPIA